MVDGRGRAFIHLVALSLAFSSLLSADIIRETTPVNFFTLAANQDSFTAEKIELAGWIYFYEFESGRKVYLFPSNESLSSYNLNESITVEIPVEDFDKAKDYLDRHFVTVYGTYNAGESEGVFGTINQIIDIDIRSSSEKVSH